MIRLPNGCCRIQRLSRAHASLRLPKKRAGRALLSPVPSRDRERARTRSAFTMAICELLLARPASRPARSSFHVSRCRRTHRSACLSIKKKKKKKSPLLSVKVSIIRGGNGSRIELPRTPKRREIFFSSPCASFSSGALFMVTMKRRIVDLHEERNGRSR